MHLFDAPLYSQLLAALLSSILLLKKRTFFIKVLTLYLVITFVVELIGTYLSSIRGANFRLYHYYAIFSYFTIFILFRSVLKEKKYLKIVYVLLVLLVILWGLTFFDKNYMHYTAMLGSLCIGGLIFLYLRELLLSNEIVNYKKLLPFWVSVGFLVFHLPAIPFFSFWSYMKNRDLVPILHSLIVLMNIIISFGLIWSSRKVEY